MLKLSKLAAVLVAAFMYTSTAQAALNIQAHDAVGGVATVPWLAGGPQGTVQTNRLTVATLTNATTNWVTFHITFFTDDWQVRDIDCQLSPMETTFFVFETAGGGTAKVTHECSSQATFNLNIVRTTFLPGERGFALFHARINGGGNTTTLIADFTVFDFNQGYAFSANGYHFQQQFETENLLLNLPATLASSFIAPDDDITAELLLYTPNGIANTPAPFRVGGNVFDDDEASLSSFANYDCFALVSLESIFGPNVQRTIGPNGFPYFVGHVTLSAQFLLSGQSPFSPFVPFGFQRVPFLGYLIQTIDTGGDLNDNLSLGSQSTLTGDMAGDGAWSRKMLRTLDSELAGVVVDPACPNPFGPCVVP